MTITSAKNQIRIAIDRGGTFTDCIGNPGTGKIEDDVFIKLLSVDRSAQTDMTRAYCYGLVAVEIRSGNGGKL